MSRLHVVHTTTFRYDHPVVASYNEARITPVSEPGQSVLGSTLEIHPVTWSMEYRDYWGTAVSVFEVLAPHESLEVRAEHRVELAPVVGGHRALAGWDVVTSAGTRNRLAEFLAETPSTAVPAEVVELAQACAVDREPSVAAEAVCLAIRDAMEYVPGSTAVHTPAADAWATRRGVCQDMAHLAVGALRSVGIPARYVSGYFYPGGDEAIGEAIDGESHAWVEWWAGEWTAYDPTNRMPVGEHHVVIGRGRAYEDVTPLRGTYAGAGGQHLEVTVRITKEA